MSDTIRPEEDFSSDPATLALVALAWLLGDSDRAERLLALTGMTAEGLRAAAHQPQLLAEVIRYLEGHEADLVAAADAVGVSPTRLVNARIELERQT